jgi:GNAT superfamily N-acetyltransferase
MTLDDLAGSATSSRSAFGDLRRRLGVVDVPAPDPHRAALGEAIVRQLVTGDPDGAWVADAEGTVVGVALAGLREGLWYLAQLHLEPACQGQGIGRRLLAAAMAYGPARGMLLHSSLDPNAMRTYQRAGFSLEPALQAKGPIRRDRIPPVTRVRVGTVEDLGLVAEVDRAVRGAAHGVDIDVLLLPYLPHHALL